MVGTWCWQNHALKSYWKIPVLSLLELITFRLHCTLYIIDRYHSNLFVTIWLKRYWLLISKHKNQYYKNETLSTFLYYVKRNIFNVMFVCKDIVVFMWTFTFKKMFTLFIYRLQQYMRQTTKIGSETTIALQVKAGLHNKSRWKQFSLSKKELSFYGFISVIANSCHLSLLVFKCITVRLSNLTINSIYYQVSISSVDIHI